MSTSVRTEHALRGPTRPGRLAGRAHQWYSWAAIILLTWITFGLRLYRLEDISLRGDEAFDVLFASQSLAEIIYQDRFHQIYPPLYHVGLHHWLLAMGRGEFALRWITAVVPGTLVTPLVYALGLRLFGHKSGNAPGIGLLAGWLAAVNPYLLWWSQDAHFYSLLVMFASATTLLAIHFWRQKGNWRIGRIYVVVTVLGFYTHYYTYFSWGAVNLIGLWFTLTRRWSKPMIVRWWSAQAAALALYSPWLLASFNMVNSYVEPWIEHVPFYEMLSRNLTAYSVHLAAQESWASWAVLVAGAIFVVGVVPWSWRPGHRSDSETRNLITLLVLIFAPLLVLYLASLYRPLYDEKLTIFVMPLYLVGLARGLYVIRRAAWPLAVSLGLVLSGSMLFSDYRYFSEPAYAKSPDWREAISYIHRKAQPGDLLIYNFPEPAVLHYNAEMMPVALIPDSSGLSSEVIGARMEQAVSSYRRAWLIPLPRPWWDAKGDVIAWLDRHADRVDQRFFRGVHVSLYLTPVAWQAEMTPHPAQFANGLRLQGFRLKQEESATTGPTLSAGDALDLSLYWQADGPTDTPYTVFTHLVGPDGQIYGGWDNPPVRGTYATTRWLPDQSVVDQYEIPISPNAPPGEYELFIGLYDPVTGNRSPVIDEQGAPNGDQVRLSKIITLR